MAVISVDNVAMSYKLSAEKITSFKGYFVAAMKKQIKKSEHLVFKNLDFKVEKGEVVGIVGRNGAGKSTLLKIIAGVLNPTVGKVEVTGSIVPMLELGSGFDFDLTGRENIYLNGSILGYSEKFLKNKYDEIVDFSELGEFIDQPIRNYSSGMIARLAFAIATVVEPEILIVDEILAVGDEAFQKKSKRKMLSLMGGGCTVLFVSHSVAQIREMCTKVLWLENGKMRMFGDTKKVCDAYQEFLNPKKFVAEDDLNLKSADLTKKKCRDVMYVFGERGLNYYYRVGIGKEELYAVNLQAGEVFYEYLDDEIIYKNNIFIFSDCPKTDRLIECIHSIKNQGKAIVFDVSCDSNELLDDVYEAVDGVIVSDELFEDRYTTKKVYTNPYVASDRIMQLADWAVYDKEVLPFIDENSITSEDMMINYNRAKSEYQERKKFERNILFINDTLSDDRITDNLYNIVTCIKSNPQYRLFTLRKWKEQIADLCDGSNVEYIDMPLHEELPKAISKVDDLLVFEDDQYNAYNEVLKLLARIVKTRISTITSTGGILSITKDINKEFKYEHCRHTVYMGDKYRNFIECFLDKRCGIVLEEINEKSIFVVEKILQLMPNYVVPIIICKEDFSDKFIRINEKSISIYSLSENYIGMRFIQLIAIGYEAYEYTKLYEYADNKYCIIDGLNVDDYDDGDLRKFMINRIYYEHSEIKLLSLSSINTNAGDMINGKKCVNQITEEIFYA